MLLLIRFWNKRKQAWFLLGIRVLTLFIIIDCSAEWITIEKNIYFANTGDQYYKIYDNYLGEVEREFMQTQDSLSRLKQFCEWLSCQDSFSYENINTQSILIDKISDSVKSIQVNKVFFQVNTVTAEKGELFYEEDYKIESMEDLIPVLVGTKYSYMDIGSTFTFHYMGHSLKGQVKGILSSNSSFLMHNEIKGLDSYIVMPSLEFTRSPKTKEEYTFQMKLYLDKASGIIISDKPARIIKNEIDDICSSLKLVPYEIEGYQFRENNIWGSMGKKLKQTNQVFLFYTILISIIGSAIECQSRILQLKRGYAILNLNGFTRKKIIAGVILGIFLEAICSGVLIIVVDYFLSRHTYIYPYLWLYLLCIIFISAIVCLSIMKKERYWNDVRGKKYGNHLS